MYSVGFTQSRCIFVEETHVHLKLAHILHVTNNNSQKSVLGTGMVPLVLMRERMPHQPTSIQVLLMTGSKYMVEHRNLKIEIVPDQSC